jgi:hypothetical protein
VEIVTYDPSVEDYGQFIVDVDSLVAAYANNRSTTNPDDPLRMLTKGSLYDYYNSYDYLASTLWQRVSEVFKGEIANRYFELRKNILTKEHVMNLFYDFENMIPRESFKKEEARWTLIPGYSYTQIEKFLDIRIPLIDNKMKKRKES